MTEAGRKLPPVSPEHPAFFQLHSTGSKQMGDVSGGVKPLELKDLESVVLKSLAGRGYFAGKLPELRGVCSNC